MKSSDEQDSGRFDLPVEDLRGITVALLTAMKESPDLAVQYIADTFPTVDPSDFPSAFRALGFVVGQLITIVNGARRLPNGEVYIDRVIEALIQRDS